MVVEDLEWTLVFCTLRQARLPAGGQASLVIPEPRVVRVGGRVGC